MVLYLRLGLLENRRNAWFERVVGFPSGPTSAFPDAEDSLQTSLPAFALSLLMLAAFALAIGGGWLIAKARDRKRGGLMLLAALVFFANVLIWTLPG